VFAALATGWPGRCAFAVASGALLTVGYQPFALSAAGWIALAPFLIAVDGASGLAAIGLGWLTGSITGLGVAGYWIWRAAIDYFGVAPLSAAAFTLGVIEVFVAPFFALFGLLAVRCGGGVRRLLLVPAALVSSEYARALLLGNPWELLGHTQRSLAVLQIASLTGVYGVSFLLALTATALVDALRPGRGARGRRLLCATVAVGAVTAVLALGAWRLAIVSPAEGEARVLLVQGNLSNAQRSPAAVARALQVYLELSKSVRPVPPLVIWPENAIPIFPEENASLLAPLREWVARTDVTVVAGAPRAGDRAGAVALYNSVYAVSADGMRSVYDKRHLLPFVERFALRQQDGPYLPGDVAAAVPLGSVRAGFLVCYEIIFPGAAGTPIASGADLLINLSNDSWFEAGAGPAQHWELTRWRAVEDAVSVVRATNSGISGAFDPQGRELARLPARTAVAGAVGVPLRSGGSFYARHGDWFALACVATVALGLAPLKRRRGAA